MAKAYISVVWCRGWTVQDCSKCCERITCCSVLAVHGMCVLCMSMTMLTGGTCRSDIISLVISTLL